MTEIRRASSVAAIMLSDEAIAVLLDLRHAHQAALGSADLLDALRKESAGVRAARDLIVAAARKDLGTI